MQGPYSSIFVIWAMQVSVIGRMGLHLAPGARQRPQVFGVPSLTL